MRLTRRAFTLLELLIVVGIVAVLVAILLPTVSAAREQAKSVKCLSNLRQLAQAASVYCANNLDSYPVAYWTEHRPGVVVNYNWDFTTTRDAAGTSVTPGLLWSGQTSPEVHQCPSYEGRSNTAADPFTGYNYNTSYIGHGQFESVAAPARVTGIRNPSLTALFGDGQYAGGANKFMRSPFPAPGDAAFTSRSSGTQGFRHNGKTNVVFCDGHAETLKDRYTATSDPIAPAPGTGFVSADNSMYGGS